MGEQASAAAAAIAAHSAADSDFNWELGVVLAGCSFEAYADINPENPGLAQRTTSGVNIWYTNDTFLKEKMAGMLAVVAVSASEEGIKSLAGSAPQPLRWEVCIGEDSTVDVPMAEVATSEEDSASAASGSFSVGDGKVDAASCRGGGRFLFVRDAHRQRLSVRLVDAKGVAVGWGTCPLDDVSADGDLHGAEVVVAGDDLDLGVPVRLQLRYTPFSGE